MRSEEHRREQAEEEFLLGFHRSGMRADLSSAIQESYKDFLALARIPGGGQIEWERARELFLALLSEEMESL